MDNSSCEDRKVNTILFELGAIQKNIGILLNETENLKQSYDELYTYTHEKIHELYSEVVGLKLCITSIENRLKSIEELFENNMEETKKQKQTKFNLITGLVLGLIGSISAIIFEYFLTRKR